MKKINWNPANTPVELHNLLSTLQNEYPIFENAEDAIRFKRVASPGHLNVGSDVIEYNTVSNAARGIGLMLADLKVVEKVEFSTLGIMLDCSRNAVMTVNHIKKWLRQIALMGYNMAMLYTEDTFLLPDEPYFGYMRGAYSFEEIIEIDDYAYNLGIELIPCIQVLGHLEQILHWEHYAEIRDTSSVLMVDTDETYRLIGKMLDFWSKAVRTRRIHVGMDETHDLGRGKFMDKFGYERGFEIFNRHLTKVNAMCIKAGLKPMIWSDMYFRMGNEQSDYYAKDTVIPEDVKNAIPNNVELVYWDYYHNDKEFYYEWIKRHRELGSNPLMASGIWTWGKFWYDHKKTIAAVKPCIDACVDMKVKELFFTMWGDDGSYCQFDSAMAGLCWAAASAYGSDNVNVLRKTMSAITNSDYDDLIYAAKLEGVLHAANVLWDDPLMGKWYNEYSIKKTEELELFYRTCKEIITDLKNKRGIVEYVVKLASIYINKIDFRKALIAAYDSRDSERLTNIEKRLIPELVNMINDFSDLFRSQWLEKFKPNGMEFIQVRLGGQVLRFQETAKRIEELTTGKIESIAELENRTVISTASLQWGHYSKWAFSCVSRW